MPVGSCENLTFSELKDQGVGAIEVLVCKLGRAIAIPQRERDAGPLQRQPFGSGALAQAKERARLWQR